MIETLRQFFETNIVLVFFVYGQVFFVLGLAIALQSRHHSRLEMARSLGWLAAFGISHGLHEWGAIFIPVQSTYIGAGFLAALQITRVILLAVSFAFLFQFGAEMISGERPYLRYLSLVILLFWVFWSLIQVMFFDTDIVTWSETASIWARYLLGFPGGLLAAYGLRFQAARQIMPLNLRPIYRTVQIAGLAMAGYALVGGLIVPAGNFFPANWLNEPNVVVWLGTPAPVFRSLTGLVMMVAMVRTLEVFDVEIDRLIEQMEVERNLVAERERIGRELHDGAIQQVYTAGLIVEAARGSWQDAEKLVPRLDKALMAMNQAITSLRTYLTDLQTEPDTTVTLTSGLRKLTNDPRLTALMDIDLTLDLAETAVLSRLQTNRVLAIVSEALANAARHAQARRVTVCAGLERERLQLIVEDDGTGFHPGQTKSGFGLRHMHDRARLLGGQLTIDSQPDGGTRVHLDMPWEEENG